MNKFLIFIISAIVLVFVVICMIRNIIRGNKDKLIYNVIAVVIMISVVLVRLYVLN